MADLHDKEHRLFPTSARMSKWELIYTQSWAFFLLYASSWWELHLLGSLEPFITLETKLWTDLSLLMFAIVRLNNLRIRNTNIGGLKWRGHSLLSDTRRGVRQIGWLSQETTELCHRLWGPLDFSHGPIKKGRSWAQKQWAWLKIFQY